MSEQEDILIYDIESSTNGLPDPETDRLRVFGCYSYITKKYYLLTDKEDIQRTINKHKYLVGFNIKKYDNIVLKREGIKLDYKIIIDLFTIIDKRQGIIQIKKGLLKDLLMDRSLKFITQTLGLVTEESGKMELDYKILRKEKWTDEETKLIKEYTIRDLEITKKLYDWLEEYFSMFKEFILEEDIKKKRYLTDTPPTFAYRVICKELGLNSEFEHYDEFVGEDEGYKGGYVAYPAGERFDGNIAYFDFGSLYPNIFLQCNLFSDKCTCCTQEEKWHGGGFFPVQGYYCSKKLGKIENIFKRLLLLREEYKLKKMRQEMAIKIFLNSSYGATANKAFKHIHNIITAGDCTLIGRCCIRYVRKRFRQEGYINIMADTDSNVVLIPEGKTVQDAINLAAECVKELQQYMPFPW